MRGKRFWLPALMFVFVILTACQSETTTSVPTERPTRAAVSSTAAAATSVLLTPSPSDSPIPQTPQLFPTNTPNRAFTTPVPVPISGPTLSVPTPTARPAATQAGPKAGSTPEPGPTTAPPPTPAVDACRVSYPAPIVSDPAVPDEPADGDRVFRSLTVHPSDPDTFLLGTERNGFMLSRDGGNTWTRLRAGTLLQRVGLSGDLRH